MIGIVGFAEARVFPSNVGAMLPRPLMGAAIFPPAVSAMRSIPASLMLVAFFLATSADFRHGDIPAIQRF
ncbi:MAG: hypothetical protein ACR65R_07160 [Methylomicrobium sp.]